MKKEKIIFKSGRKNFVFEDIVRAIKKLGINKGDIVMAHADLAVFGKLGDVVDRAEFANVFIKSFEKILGKEGTLIVPTFTYSFCNNEIYDPDNSPSKVGLFTEELRKRKDAYRSIDPIFSVAAIGKRAKELTQNVGKDCFGKESIFDELRYVKNAKYVIFGVNYFSCTYVHYLERIMEVPYRFLKKFKGKIKIKNKEYEDEYGYYVRTLDKNINPDFDKIEKHLFKKKLLKKIKLGSGYISSVKIRDVHREGLLMLKKNPYFFLKNTPNL